MLVARILMTILLIVSIFGAFSLFSTPDFANSVFSNESLIGPLNFVRNGPESSNLEKIENRLIEILDSEKGTYGVAVIDLSTDTSYFYNEREQFDSASLYKLWVMAVTYQQLESELIKKDTYMSQSVSALNSKFNIDPRFAERTSGYSSGTITDALKKMITVSDNYSALLLTDTLQINKIEQFLDNGSYEDSNFGSADALPVTSARDVALFLSRLYKGELGSEVSTNEMLQLLEAQQLNSKLPKGLPDSVVIAHKTGELGQFSHDAGIVYTPKGNYVIVVLSRTSDPMHANEVISEISKAVYSEFLR